MPNLPIALIAVRAGLAPCVVCVAALGGGWAPPVIVAIMAAALVTDVLDGIVARRLGIATAALRQLDSQVDAVFWICAIMAAIVLHGASLWPAVPGVILILALEVGCQAASRLRFGRGPSTHALSAKLFGLMLFAGHTEITLAGSAGPWFWSMVAVGTVAQIEVILILLTLPRWESDVPTLWHAYRLRQGCAIRRHWLLN